MPPLRKLQRQFMSFLQSQDGAIGSCVLGDNRLDVPTRLEIYRNAYSTRLKKSIETDHPVLGSYLGDDLFELMAGAYITACPSAYPSLREFADSLPGYLENNEPFSDNPIIAEIALFERRLLFAFDAADAERAQPDDLQTLAPEDWPAMRVQFHPSACLFTAHWNSVESWQALKEDQAPPAAVEQLQHWLLWRGDDRLTQFQPLSVEGEIIFSALAADKTFAEVCESLLEGVAEEQVSACAAGQLVQWLEAGVVSKIP